MNHYLKRFIPALAVLGLTACAGMHGQHAHHGPLDTAPPGGEYAQVSELVPLPAFIPGLGTLYVQPATLPAGPFLAYDRDDRLVSTIYMIPLDDLNARKNFPELATAERKVVRTELAYNAGHPGVAEPHYHIVLWHVPPAEAKLK
ncbi:hypothetical protein [Alkalilimnicola sp. S0819]|uniref:hypothetical protein n=1 Tax=Alkalilimnicola sp. S0819 TaxID=2613922 RepID=UPI001261E3D9|nr:hypothetical protein [Alkalilimnicola sp. S0819]KAB7624198.1 hypothetical protein F3N43_07360 [Alkalilimnicola sp. S0819]MPQ16453.1 hypothetical protein [Alkalilimnicola sp. S0819]